MTRFTTPERAELPLAPAPSSSRSLLQLFDFCKGIGIILVMLIHYYGGWFGWQAVHLFIVFSGFGLTYACLKREAHSEQPVSSWKPWYIKRLSRILPTYWLICLIGYVVLAAIEFSEGHSLLESLSFPKRTLLLDVTLLKNFVDYAVVTVPNVSLWFVPFIVSCYLVFPWLYRWMRQRRTAAHVLSVFAATIAIELLYRVVTIYWLDGSPIGYRSFEHLFTVIGVPFDRIPASFPFQGEATFGWVPSRIGEFALGMVGGIAGFNSLQRLEAMLLNPWAMLGGLLVWILGDWLLYQGFWGWVVADFIIAVGITITLLNGAAIVFQYLPRLFRWIDRIGGLSYYLFLAHFVPIYLFLLYIPDQTHLQVNLLRARSLSEVFLSLVVITMIISITAGLSYLLRWFDRSKFSDLLIQKTIARLLR